MPIVPKLANLPDHSDTDVREMWTSIEPDHRKCGDFNSSAGILCILT